MTSNYNIPRHVFPKARYLLPMEYKIRELSRELELPYGTVRDWVKIGSIPHRRDGRKHIFVYGPDVRQWVMDQRQQIRKTKLPNDYAYCLRCNQPVRMKDPEIIERAGASLLGCTCHFCGTKVFKGVKNDK